MSTFVSLMIFFLVCLLVAATLAGAIGVLLGCAVVGFDYAFKMLRGAR